MPHARLLAPMPRLLLALALVASMVIPVAARPKPTWKQAPGIEITAELRPHIEAVARIYFEKTRRPLEITSGYRSPRRQAEAMYVKLAVGGSLALYKRQDLTRPLLDAYRQGRKKRWKKDRIVTAMAEVLQSQVDRGQYLSRHMRGLAFDVRSTGMSSRQRQALLAAVREVGQMRIIHERRPPHYHIEVIIPRAPRKAEVDATPDTSEKGDDDGDELLEREEP